MPKDVKPLHEPMPGGRELDTQEHISMEFNLNVKPFH